jgi:5'-nucleotidase
VGTNDLHGRLGMLPWLGGHLANLRRARAHDGAVILLDGGDMFQGTLESNLNEGAAVIRAYNTLGYAAAAIGNHEFDYGPEGAVTFARHPNDDPQGALRARAREANFPLLTANIVMASTGEPPPWDNVFPRVMLTVAGVKVGVVGLSTEATARSTLALNFRNLVVRPLAEAVRYHAAALRAEGAWVVVVVAHAGGTCRHFDNPSDLSSCEPDEEIFQVARALPAGMVDVIVAGHTHRGVAHLVNDIAVIESFANGRAFGRVDLTVDTNTRRVVDRRIHPPRDVCGGGLASRDDPDPDTCEPSPYEGAPVVADATVREAIAPAMEAARTERRRRVGFRAETAIRTRYRDESPLTNLVADMMRAAVPRADVALMNAGGVRIDLPAGELDYGTLYSVLPFDNRLVTVRMRAGALRAFLAHNAEGDSGTVAVSGVRATAVCEGGRVAVHLTREDGRTVNDEETLTVATNDYTALGALEGRLIDALTDEAIAGSPVLRDAVGEQLARIGRSSGEDPRWYDPTRPRMVLPMARPVRCALSPRP